MKLFFPAAVFGSLATARFLPAHYLSPHVSRPHIHHVEATKSLNTRHETPVAERSEPSWEPITVYPPAAENHKVVVIDGQRQCETFSPTAGHTWGPCGDTNKSNEPKHDFREKLQAQWCGPDRLCGTSTWITPRKKVGKGKKSPP